MLATCAASSSNWRRLRFSRTDNCSTLVTDCSTVLATAVESSPAIFSVGMYPGVCRVVVLLSRDKMERANSISIGRLPGRSVDVHPPNGSYPSLPSTTVFWKPIESVGRIFRVAYSAANNTTRHRHYVKRLAELTATLGGSGQIFSLEVSSLAIEVLPTTR